MAERPERLFAETELDLPFSITAEEICSRLEVETSRGLTCAAAAEKLLRQGPNSIADAKDRSILKLLFAQFSGVIVWLLVAASVIAWFTESRLEAVSISIVLLINTLVGFAIEWKASRSLSALRAATQTQTLVRREGHESMIDSAELVPGDIVVMTAGNRVPADCVLIEAVSLQTDESGLTGESAAVNKSVGVCPRTTPLAERTPMVFLGTNVVRGHALAIVTATGAATEIGRVGKLLSETVVGKTPLEQKLADLGQRLVYIVIVIVAVIMLTGFIRGDDWWLMLKVSISLAVAAVPEGLPAVTTLILGLGVLRMARRNAIVRKLSAVETLGSTTVICTDKTGTLTENRMTVREYRLADGAIIEIDDDNEPIEASGNLEKLLRVSILCNEAAFDRSGSAIGDPTETALLIGTRSFLFDAPEIRKAFRTIHERPFDAATKRMISVAEDVHGNRLATLKGAPAVVLNLSREYLDQNGTVSVLDDAGREHMLKINEAMADRALRVLAFAERNLRTDEDPESAIDDFVFLGFCGMSDPPRDGVFESIEAAHRAGIRVVMLTGDQLNTARAIATELGLSRGAVVFALHSDDLKHSDIIELATLAKKTHVFARVTPEDKLRIVEALQQAGEIVAVTGDGVNDAPALKRADVGVAMGMRGTEVSKEAADIVLTDDNFSTIVAAIEGGRTIYANIRKFVHWMFSSNLAEVIVIFVPIAAGYPLPLLPLQILWVNLVTDVLPALALAVEPASPQTMKRPPLSPTDSLLSRRFLVTISLEAIMLSMVVIGVYLWALGVYGEGAHSRTIALLALVGGQIGHLFNCRSDTRSAFSGFFSNPYIFGAIAIVVVLQFLAFHFTPLMRILDTVSPNATDYIVVAVAVLTPVVIVEAMKFVRRRRNESDPVANESN